jgi:hypothetical protein
MRAKNVKHRGHKFLNNELRTVVGIDEGKINTVTPALRVRVRQVACSVDAPYRAHLQTMMFLQLVAGGHLMLFLTRTPGAFWKPPFPGSKLFWAIVGTHTRRFAPALTSPTIPGRQYEL